MDRETLRDQDDTVDRLVLYADKLREQGHADVSDAKRGSEPGWEWIEVEGHRVHVRPADDGVGFLWMRYTGPTGVTGPNRGRLIATAWTRGRLEVPCPWAWRDFGGI